MKSATGPWPYAFTEGQSVLKGCSKLTNTVEMLQLLLEEELKREKDTEEGRVTAAEVAGRKIHGRVFADRLTDQ